MRQYDLEKPYSEQSRADNEVPRSFGRSVLTSKRMSQPKSGAMRGINSRLLALGRRPVMFWVLPGLLVMLVLVWLAVVSGSARAPAMATPLPGAPSVLHLGVLYVSSKVELNNPSVKAGVEGLIITEVKPGSPAYRAGISPGDLLVKVDNRPVAAEDSLLNLLATYRSGDRLRLEVLRNSLPIVFEVTLN